MTKSFGHRLGRRPTKTVGQGERNKYSLLIVNRICHKNF